MPVYSKNIRTIRTVGGISLTIGKGEKLTAQGVSSKLDIDSMGRGIKQRAFIRSELDKYRNRHGANVPRLAL